MNYLLDLGKVSTLITFACGLITIALYIAFKITKNYERLSLIVVIFLSFIFFPTMWLVTGGTFASIPYYMIINAGIIALLLTGLQRKILLLLFALVVAGLMVMEYRVPDLVVSYDSDLVRYIDLAFGLFICLFAIAVLISVLIDCYVGELKKSKQYLEALEEKNKEKLTVAMVDIDNFKMINDKYGHLFGDYVLKRIVRTIISNLRQDDIVGRYGGDEFLIILRDTSKEKGYAMMERVRKKILELEWEDDLIITISGGIIEVEGEEVTDLLKKVDKLLYRAKHKKKNLIEKDLGG